MIWLVGNRGMLGTEVHRRFQTNRLEHVATDLEVDIADPKALRRFSEIGRASCRERV